MTGKFAAVTIALLASWAGTASAATIIDLETLGNIFSWTNNTTDETASVSTGAVMFQFAIATVLGPAFASFDGTVNLTATTTTPATGPDPSGNYDEPGWSGSGSLTDTSPGTYNGVVIFSWTWGSSGLLSVAANGTGGSFGDSTPPLTEVTFSSPILNFGTVVSQSWGLSFGSPANWTIGPGGFLNSNTGGGVVTFDGVPTPTGIPEPATMLMMGSALVGLGMLGRKRFARNKRP
jgi:hypothetical protein